MNQIARGIITPILTPMYDDESINYEELKNQVERLITAGVSGLFVFGTNGESYVLNEEERRSVLKTVVEQTAKRVPVFAGTGFPGTKETIRQSLNAQELGADALSLDTLVNGARERSPAAAISTPKPSAAFIPALWQATSMRPSRHKKA